MTISGDQEKGLSIGVTTIPEEYVELVRRMLRRRDMRQLSSMLLDEEDEGEDS